MEQPVTFAKFNGIPQGLEGEGLVRERVLRGNGRISG
jgi:hypothetical protein